MLRRVPELPLDQYQRILLAFRVIDRQNHRRPVVPDHIPRHPLARRLLDLVPKYPKQRPLEHLLRREHLRRPTLPDLQLLHHLHHMLRLLLTLLRRLVLLVSRLALACRPVLVCCLVLLVRPFLLLRHRCLASFPTLPSTQGGPFKPGFWLEWALASSSQASRIHMLRSSTTVKAPAFQAGGQRSKRSGLQPRAFSSCPLQGLCTRARLQVAPWYMHKTQPPKPNPQCLKSQVQPIASSRLPLPPEHQRESIPGSPRSTVLPHFGKNQSQLRPSRPSANDSVRPYCSQMIPSLAPARSWKTVPTPAVESNVAPRQYRFPRSPW